MDKKYYARKYKMYYTREVGFNDSIRICNADDTVTFINSIYDGCPIEKPTVLALDNANKIIGYIALDGETNQAPVYPKTVFRFLLTCGASAFIMVHNHPGGSTKPSEADWKLTRILKKLGEGLDLPMLDHVIYADDEQISMRRCDRWVM